MDALPVDFFVTSMQFTKRVSRDVYPAVDPTSAELSMAGKVVIITGASQGLGARVRSLNISVYEDAFANINEKGLVPAFAKAGAKTIVLVARNTERLEVLAKELNQSFPKVETLVCPADISDAVRVKELYRRVNDAYGHADILVNNAGMLKAEGALKSVDPELWWNDLVSSLAKKIISPVSLLTTSSTAHQCSRNVPDDSELPQISTRGVSWYDHQLDFWHGLRHLSW